MARRGRDFIARHGETVFNAVARFQGVVEHTPLTRAGFGQADEMGRALALALGDKPALTPWASPAGRALQTLAIVAEHVGVDWHTTRTDPRLAELSFGSWGGRSYAEIIAEAGPIVRRDGLVRPSPDGETYRALAERLRGWIADSEGPSDRLIVMHGLSSRILRGLLLGRGVDEEFGTPTAPGLPQGSLVMIESGRETVIHLGAGHAPA